VTVTIRAAATKGIKHIRRTCAELGVGGANAGVNDVSKNACTGPVEGVDCIQRPVALVDAIQALRWIALRGVCRDDTVFFNIRNSEVLT